MNCEYCGMAVHGIERNREDGKALHISCAEKMPPTEEEGSSIKVFEVELRYRGRCTVRVIARTEDEAIDIAQSEPVDTFDMDVDIDGIDALDESPSDSERHEYEEREKRAFERRMRKKLEEQRATP